MRYQRQAETGKVPSGPAAGGQPVADATVEPRPTLMECFIRKFSAETRPWIKMHADVATVTVNVALTSESTGAHGQLLGVYDGAVRAIPRQAGDATVHPSSLPPPAPWLHDGCTMAA